MTETLVKPLSDRKEEILQSARSLFSKKGFVSASMRDLASVLDIKPASLYSNFKSKDDILWEISLRCAQAFFQAVEPAFLENTPPLEKISKMLDAHIEVLINNRDASAIFFEEWKHLDGPHLQEFSTLRERYENMFIETLETGVEAHVFQALPAKFISHTLLSSVNWVSRWYAPDGSMTVADIKATLKSFILGGIQARNSFGTK